MSIASSAARSVARPVARAVSAVGDGGGYEPLTNLALDSLTASVAISPQYLGGTTGQAWADARLPTVNVEKGYGSTVFQDLYPDPTTGELFTAPDGGGVTATVFADGEKLLVQTPYNQSLADTVTGHPTPISDDRRVLLDISVPTSPCFAGIAQGTQDASQHATERGYDVNVSVVSNLGVNIFALDCAQSVTMYKPVRNNGGSTIGLTVEAARWYDFAALVVSEITTATTPSLKAYITQSVGISPTLNAVVGAMGGYWHESQSATVNATSTPLRIWGASDPLNGRAWAVVVAAGELTRAQTTQISTRLHATCKAIFSAAQLSLYGPKIGYDFPVDPDTEIGQIRIELASGAGREIEASYAGAAYESIGTTDSNGYLSADYSVPENGRNTLNVRVVGQATVYPMTLISAGITVVALGQSNALGRGDDFTISAPWGAQKSWIAKWADDVSIARGHFLFYRNWAAGGTYLYYNTAGSTDGRHGHWNAANPGSSVTSNIAEAIYRAALFVRNATYTIWHQGESETVDFTSEADYKAALIVMWNRYKSETGQTGKLWVMQIGRSGAETDSDVDEIRRALVNVCDENPTLFEFGGCLAHLEVENALDAGQLVHFYTLAQKQAVVDVFQRHALGAGRGPRYSSMTASGTTITVTCTGGVTPLTVSGGEAASPIGWTVTDGSGSKTVTAVSVSNLVITLTTSGAALTGTVTVKWLSHYSGIGTTLLDSDATTPVPPEPFSQSVAAT